MNPLIQSAEEAVKEFDNEFSRYRGSFGNQPKKEVRAFLLQSYLAMWESEVGRIGRLQDREFEGNYQKEIGWDSALNAVLEPYKDAMEWAKKQLK